MTDNDTELMAEAAPVVIDEYTILAKFEGEALPENLVEQIHIDNGLVVRVDKFENGELVSSEEVETPGEVE